MTIFGRRPCWSTTYLTRWPYLQRIRVLPEYYSSLQDEKAKERYVEKISYVGGLDPYRIPRKEWSDSIELWPGVIVNPVPPIFCIPVRNSLVNMAPPYDSLVNCVWGYRIPVGYFVSPYVSPTWILYPPTDSTTRLRRSSRNVSANDLESWGNGQLFLWQRIATRTLDLT